MKPDHLRRLVLDLASGDEHSAAPVLEAIAELEQDLARETREANSAAGLKPEDIGKRPRSKLFDPKARGDNRLSAYYYGFSRTGCEAVDDLLAAVAAAGKAHHNTSDWDEPGAGEDDDSESYIEAIQRLAQVVAARLDVEADRSAALFSVLADLVELRDNVKPHAPDEYERRKPAAWADARSVLDRVRS